ncbi:unnamed protein product (macronuclear) [Paramecium tetraurelia]|uniref:Ion transport domain-containing protein n=1 Tax=Paramecium tetraurelia TaxID=5888 RepID=A0BWH4_PARTE|nr:uncharacterized protein GSPATT00032743001 [Paramecium tetraurelia]CAK62891.1 unnamed protein product [Paramecium tetraurelia]|eukprot:XP_001430289.1 hypothetical protein (macronuclear) [Paramecium tetraurelia strain d4-2]
MILKIIQTNYQMQNCKHIITTIRMSKFYILFSILQVILSIILLIYIMTDPIRNLHQSIVVQAEVILTLAILVDISLRIIAERKQFFKDKWNLIDLGSFILILILLLFFYMITNEFAAIIDDVIGLVVMVLRYIVQIVRLALLIKQSHKVKQLQQIDDIKFEQVDKQNEDSIEKQQPDTNL